VRRWSSSPTTPATASPELGDLIVVGRVRRAHGVRGAFAVESLNDAPDVIFASGAVVVAGDRDGRPAPEGELHIEDGRPMNREWLVRVREVTDRDAADLWRGRYLLADEDRLPPPDPDELYLRDLIGMEVAVDGRGVVGTVRDLYTVPQGLLLEVQTTTGTPLVPWREELIERFDEAGRRIVFKPLEGLLD
jgi:16S rRNA processing protein RimM